MQTLPSCYNQLLHCIPETYFKYSVSNFVHFLNIHLTCLLFDFERPWHEVSTKKQSEF